MIRKFECIEDLNEWYAECLSELAERSENVNDEFLKLMLKEIVDDYKTNASLLLLNQKFEKRLNKRDKKFSQKEEMLDFKFNLKKRKYMYWRRWWSNFKLYRAFKKQFKIALKKEIVDEKEKLKEMQFGFKEYVQRLKNPVCESDELSHIGRESAVGEITMTKERSEINHDNEDLETDDN